MIIGVSGKSGSGKSSVSKYIADKLEYLLIDVDLISKNIRKIYKDEIVNLVKDNIVKDNEIDSKMLGKILFGDKELMDKYNAFIYTKLKEEIAKYQNVDIVIESLFLPIMDIFSDLDIKILVTCDEKNRKIRVMKRDNIDEEYFLLREKNSIDYDSSSFDYIVNNDISYKETIDDILEKIKR